MQKFSFFFFFLYFPAPQFQMGQMGYMPGMPPQGAPLPPAPPVMEQPVAPPPIEDEPPGKKARTEDNLLPEAQFMALHKGPVTLQVQIPSGSDKPEWRLNGQTVSISLALSDSVTTLKSKLQDETGMPPAKQKISYDVSFGLFKIRRLDSAYFVYFFLPYRECSLRTAIRSLFTIY